MGEITGGCLCGAVRFSGTGMRAVGACHCKMCRRFASGPFMATRFEGGVTVDEGRGLTWWKSSSWGERGFCSACGAALFWRSATCTPGDWAVSVGALDTDPDTVIFEHIFSDMKPAYYEFADDAPRVTQAQIIEKYGAGVVKAEDGS